MADPFQAGDKVLTCQVGFEINASRGTITDVMTRHTKDGVAEQYYIVKTDYVSPTFGLPGESANSIEWMHRRPLRKVSLPDDLRRDMLASIAAVPMDDIGTKTLGQILVNKLDEHLGHVDRNADLSSVLKHFSAKDRILREALDRVLDAVLEFFPEKEP